MTDISQTTSLVQNSAAQAASKPSSPPSFSRGVAINIMARTMWGECRSGGVEGMTAVGCSIMNRYKISAAHHFKFWWGNDPAGICQKKGQYDCWRANDPNFDKIAHVTIADPQFVQALKIAADLLDGKIADITHGSTHYVAKTIKKMPKWSLGLTPVAEFGGQIFFNNVP